MVRIHDDVHDFIIHDDDDDFHDVIIHDDIDVFDVIIHYDDDDVHDVIIHDDDDDFHDVIIHNDDDDFHYVIVHDDDEDFHDVIIHDDDDDDVQLYMTSSWFNYKRPEHSHVNEGRIENILTHQPHACRKLVIDVRPTSVYRLLSLEGRRYCSGRDERSGRDSVVGGTNDTSRPIFRPIFYYFESRRRKGREEGKGGGRSECVYRSSRVAPSDATSFNKQIHPVINHN